jgi:16S rRNA (guanine527-N7)-methyltransferase
MSDRDFGFLKNSAVDVSRETFDILKNFESELRRWNSRINLISENTVDNLWRRHICDCAQLPALKPNAVHWLDLGSGGGLPGLVIAIMIRHQPNARVDLVESNRKKASFLTHIGGLLKLPIQVHGTRIGDATHGVPQPEIVTARALASLTDLLDLADFWITRGATGLFQKGRDYQLEIEQSAARWQFDLIQHASKSEPGAMILEISGLKPAGDRTNW